MHLAAAEDEWAKVQKSSRFACTVHEFVCYSRCTLAPERNYTTRDLVIFPTGNVFLFPFQSSKLSKSSDVDADPRLKLLSVVSDRTGCSLQQLLIAWTIRNQTSQCCIASAATVQQFQDILASISVGVKQTKDVARRQRLFLFQAVKNVTLSTCDEIDKILGNKPTRPPMVSTLQQRWATTGGVPPC